MSKKNTEKSSIKITIEAEWGSPYQKGFQTTVLPTMLQGWRMAAEQQHKKNIIEISYDER